MEKMVSTANEKLVNKQWRSGSQPLMPFYLNKHQTTDGYRLYPYHSIGKGKIFNGYQSLARWIMLQKVVIIDGYIGVFWQKTEQQLRSEFKKSGIRVKWIRTQDF